MCILDRNSGNESFVQCTMLLIKLFHFMPQSLLAFD